MKKLLSVISIILCMMLVMSSCGADKDGESGQSSESAAVSENDINSENLPEVEEVYFRNPLNGSKMDEEYSGRVFSVSINNVEPALPFKGINSADVFFEMYVNDYCTRGLALFSDIENVPHVGSIRSTRYNFTDLALAYDTVMCFSGGSGSVINDMQETGIDYLFVDVPVGYRDEGRLDLGYSWEHTLFAHGENLYNAAKDGGMAVTSDRTDYGMKFADEGMPVNGEIAKIIDIRFNIGSSSKLTQMRYAWTLDEYTFWQYGKEMSDNVEKEAATFKNVIILFVPTENVAGEGTTYHVADLIGSGDGYYACGGRMIPIKWVHNSETDPISFTLENGTPLTQEAGSTYIAITPVGSTVDVYEKIEE